MAAYASPLLSTPAVFPGSFDYGYGALATTAYTPAFVPQPAYVPTVSAIEVDRAIAVPTVQYAQSAPVAPGYPLNLREGDFWNPAANNVFDRLVGTQAGRGGVYNNPGAKKSGGLFSRKPKAAAATPAAAPAVPVAPVAPVAPVPVAPAGIVAPGGAPIVVPPSAYATQYGASPYGPQGPVAAYGPNGLPTAFPGGIGAPFTGAVGAPYTGAVPVGAAPVAPIAGGAPVAAGKGKQKKAGPLPTLAQAEALDVAATHLAPTAWVGPPVPSGPPLTSVTQYPPVAVPAGPVFATGLPPTYTVY